jgi:hypothetical protein
MKVSSIESLNLLFVLLATSKTNGGSRVKTVSEEYSMWKEHLLLRVVQGVNQKKEEPEPARQEKLSLRMFFARIMK